MEYDQIQLNRQVFRIPLATPATTRGHNLGYDALLQNAFIETNAAGKVFVRKRPGYSVVSALNYASGAATGQGITYYSDRYYAIAGDVLYRLGAAQNSYSSGTTWTLVTSPAAFGARSLHQVVSFKGQLVSIGGVNASGTVVNDIWASFDGKAWSQVVVSAPFGPRSNMAVVVYNERIYVIGGANATTYVNDVWSSADLVNWTEETPAAAWTPRVDHRAVVFGSHIVILGGFLGAAGYTKEVWATADGVNWHAQPAPAWAVRSNFGVYVQNNELIIAGGINSGGFLKDVYYTVDTQVWTSRTANAWSDARSTFGYCVYNDKLWAIGGLKVGPSAINEIRSSADGGATWVTVSVTPGWTARYGQQAAVHRTAQSVSTIQAQTIYVVGGGNATALPEIYFAALDSAGSTSFTIITDAPTKEPFQFNQVTPSEFLIFKNSYNAYALWGNTILTLTDKDFPSRTVPGIVYLDRRIFVMDPNGFIYGSDLDDPTSFSGLNYIQAEYEPDKGMALAKYLNYVVALGERTLQFFYDTGAFPGSPLAPQMNMTQRIGCINGYTVVAMEGLLVFVGRGDTGGRAVYVIDGGKPSRVSSEEIERLLESEDTFDTATSFFYATGFGVVGHKFYMLNLPTHAVTIVFDFTEKQWSIWNYNDSAVLPFSGYVTDTGGNYFQNSTGGTILAMAEGTYSDNSVSIVAKGVTDIVDFGTSLCKYQHSATFVGSRATTASTFLTLEWSDDDYTTWCTPRFVATNQPKPWTHRGGRFYRRAYRWTHAYDLPFRAEALELQVDFGNV